MEDAVNWMKANIRRSITDFHLEGCKILIDLFKQRFQDHPQFKQAYDELMADLINKETFLIVEV